MKIITTGTGYGYPFNKKGENYESQILYTYDTEGNLYMGEGEVEATLIMQERMQYDWCDEPSDYQWEDCVIDGYDPIVKTEYDTRQIYRISTHIKQEKETQGDIIDKMIEIMPYELSVYAIPYIKEAMQIWADNQLKQSNLIDRDKVIELINEVSKTFTCPDATLALFKAITKIKEL